jgi:hypothetical protein
MTENQEGPGRKRRSGEEIKRLVLEFEASGYPEEVVTSALGGLPMTFLKSREK